MANLSNINNKFLVTTGGNVLIGATADVATVRLHVKNPSAAAVLRLTGGSDSWDFDTYYTDNKLFIKSNGAGGTVMTLLGASGNVGIGTDSPTAKLKVIGANDAWTCQIENTQALPYGLSVNTAGTAGTTFNSAFYTHSGTGMYIVNNGNVGIGITTPDAKLHIYGSTSLSEMYLGEDAAADKAGILKYTQGDGSGTGFITLSHWGNTSVTESLAIKYGGNVGIGTTTPSSKLHVVSDEVVLGSVITDYRDLAIQVETTQETANSGTGISFDHGALGAAIASARVNNSTWGTDLRFYTHPNSTTNQRNVTERMRIDQGGSVIIGAGPTSGTPTADYRSLEIGRQGNTITGAPWKSNLYFSTNATITAGSTTFTARYLNELPMLHTMEDGIFAWSNAVLPTTVGDTIVWNESMRINAKGNLGIGMTSPTASLGIKANFTANGSYTASGWSRYLVLDAASSGGGGIIWTKQSSTYNRGIMVNQGSFFVGRSTANDASAAWLTDLSINASGNVGIGTDSPDYGKLQIDTASGNNITIRKGTGQAALAFGGTSANEATFLIEGNPATQGFRAYNGAGTLASPTWSAGMDFHDGGRLHPYGGVFLGSANNVNLLTYYASDIWTPIVVTSQGTPPGINSASGRWQRVGKVVTASFEFTMNNTASGGAGIVVINNLPVAIADTDHVSGCGVIKALGKTINVFHNSGTLQIGMYFYDGNYCGTTHRTVGTVTYWAAT